MATRRRSFKSQRVEVRARLKRGTGRWLMLLCANGHLLKQFPYGEWSTARRKYGRTNATVLCGACFRDAQA